MGVVIESILAAKAARRRELAALPIERKLEILLELQRNVAEIRRSSGRPGPEPWPAEVLPAAIRPERSHT